MKIPTKIKILTYWDQFKNWLIILFISITAIALGYFGPYISKLLPWLSNISQDPVAATLIGAVFGGVIAFSGSVYVQQNQVKAVASIRRRDEIFIPLYDELLGLKKGLLHNSSPTRIVISDSDHNGQLPKLSIWRDFKKDSRQLQVPTDLANYLDKFIAIVANYNRARSNAESDQMVNMVIKEILIPNSPKNLSKFEDFAYLFLPSANNLEKTKHKLDNFTRKNEGNTQVKTKTPSEIEAIAQEIHKKCSEIESVKKMQKYRCLIDVKCDELIDVLAIIIKHINKKYEHNAKWF